MKKIFVIMAIVIIIYVVTKRPELYKGLIASVTNFASKGISTLTKGKPE